MADGAGLRDAVIARVLEGDGKATAAERRAAFDQRDVAEPARALVDKVVAHAYKITDEDFVAAKQAMSEDQIFELVVCAAIGKASRQLAAARAAIAEATR